jgi:hypothetical protein
VTVRWYLPAIALAGTAIAVWADTNLVVAVPAAGIALTAAGLLFVEAWTAGRRPSSPSNLRRRPTVHDSLRTAFRSGRMGREMIVDLLDRLERAGPNPELAPRRPEEVASLARLSPTEFRDYLRGRLDELEARS